MNRTSYVLKYFKLHACMHIIAKMHFYISLLVTRIIIKSWTLLKVTEEKFKIYSFLGSIFLHLHMHNSPFWFLCIFFVHYITNKIILLIIRGQKPLEITIWKPHDFSQWEPTLGPWESNGGLTPIKYDHFYTKDQRYEQKVEKFSVNNGII